MRAYQLPKGGAGIDALAVVDRPVPKPQYRQVLVKVAACSLNYRDLGITRGTYRMPVRENVVPLSDGAGEVVEVGPGVTRVKTGDKVAGCFFQRWVGGEPSPTLQASALGGALDGMLAEFAVLEEDGVVKIPAHLSLEEGATLPCAGVTAWDAIMNHAKLIAGQSVLLLGTGGVSIFGLQLAHAMGIIAIVTSSSDAKLARAKALGAACGINMVCDEGACIACTAGLPCTPASNSCHTGTTSCTTGVSVCVDTGTSAVNGTACGTNEVCDNGTCSACSAGATCTPTNACHTGSIDCEAGTPVCDDTGTSVANGTTCGPSKV